MQRLCCHPRPATGQVTLSEGRTAWAATLKARRAPLPASTQVNGFLSRSQAPQGRHAPKANSVPHASLALKGPQAAAVALAQAFVLPRRHSKGRQADVVASARAATPVAGRLRKSSLSLPSIRFCTHTRL